MASYCQGCKLNLNETYDEESGSCSNCGIVAETFRFETENKTGLEFNTDGANFLGLYSRPKAGYQKLTVWGWSSSSSGKKRDNILRSKGNEPVPGSQNRKERSSKVPANRELVGGYIESGMVKSC
ncbi:hypothetical protein AX774_g4995 [Zancudomyces culisetae]|uniref:Uncharacterized protein n=1 Tax=Zancudomyces culisetae TaxID=1213189 RepID=A0A1R1PKQ6_ZANCU|nr:hypothetical protein AX774_g4995 [Zancudomyces culisetae]|eukprot:OMH81545.1 hypothetical protein AX774_g4995 [Zancudomyces culisetae]